jgi:hypothetical protein
VDRTPARPSPRLPLSKRTHYHSATPPTVKLYSQFGRRVVMSSTRFIAASCSALASNERSSDLRLDPLRAHQWPCGARRMLCVAPSHSALSRCIGSRGAEPPPSALAMPLVRPARNAAGAVFGSCARLHCEAGIISEQIKNKIPILGIHLAHWRIHKINVLRF